MSISHKSGFGDLDMVNVSMRSAELLMALQAKLRVVRSYLSADLFDALVAGKLDVEAFLAQATLMSPDPKPRPKRRFSRLRSEEDSGVKDDSEHVN